MSLFSERRAELLQPHYEGVEASLSESERALESLVLRPAISESPIDPARSFLETKDSYERGTLLPLLRRMPKGAVLHTHGIASGSFQKLVELLRGNSRAYVWKGGTARLEGCMKFFAEPPSEEGWVRASDVAAAELYRYLTLPPGLPSVEACWEAFGNLWARVHEISTCAPFYFGRGGFLWNVLEAQLSSKIVYIEIKEPMFAPFTRYDGSALTDDEFVGRFRDTVADFQSANPSFIGARLVLTGLKAQSVDLVRSAYRRAVELKDRFPDSVAGFDLAGPEDQPNPLAHFAPALEEERAVAKRRGIDLPLLIHAGETNIPGASQIHDAVALRCERIGHGFALSRFPNLVREARDLGLSLECNPISNQVLGYFPNLAAHPALGLFRSGVPITISPDDPGMWHYDDVSFDYAAVAKAWDLGLAELRALARNSLVCSTLRGEQRDRALREWEACWSEWVTNELESRKTS